LSAIQEFHPGMAAMALAKWPSRTLPAMIAVLRAKTSQPGARLEIQSAMNFVNYDGDRMKQAIPVLINCLSDSNQSTVSLATPLSTILLQIRVLRSRGQQRMLLTSVSVRRMLSRFLAELAPAPCQPPVL